MPCILLCLTLALAMVAAPWWQQAFARDIDDFPAMAVCSVGGASGPGGAPAHLAAGHCQLCCAGQAQQALPPSALPATAVAGISYPLAPASRRQRCASLAPGAPRARAPPAVSASASA